MTPPRTRRGAGQAGIQADLFGMDAASDDATTQAATGMTPRDNAVFTQSPRKALPGNRPVPANIDVLAMPLGHGLVAAGGTGGLELAVGMAGVDEAGRGPLAGPVYAAAVILDPARPIAGLADSKALTAARREALAEQIREHALAWCIAMADVAEIDSLNILHATMLAMRRACLGLPGRIVQAQIDGNRVPRDLPFPAVAVVKGDATVAAISAASILAKTARDDDCQRLHALYPQYAFDQHKGYGTALHLQRLRDHGPCPAHRRSFAPVRNALAQDTAAGADAAIVTPGVAGMAQGGAS